MLEPAHVGYRDRNGGEARVAYRRAGNGVAVVLIHGVGLQGAIWEPQVEDLAIDHDVIAVDMLGHGASSLPPAETRLFHYADAILALLDALYIDRAHLIGHSMGALVALECALDHPERVRSVVAINAVFCRSPAQRAAIEARLGSLEDKDERRPDWDATLARWFGTPVPAGLRGAAESTRHLLEAIDPIGYARTYRLFARSDAEHRHRLAGLTVPALFITGEQDPNSTPAMSEAMAVIAPHSEVQIVPGARHLMTLTDVAAVNGRLRAFIDGAAPAMSAVGATAAAPLDPRALRKAFGVFPTGVTVVATTQEDGRPRGFTANSFTSVSLDPPLLSVCVAKTAASCPVFTGTSHFSVNVLAEHQATISRLFASKAPDKFAEAAWRRGPAGSPILNDVAAWFDCRLRDVIEAGDHFILLGEVVGFDEGPANPLGYCRGAHLTFGLPLDALAAGGGRTRLGAILEHEGRIVLVEDGRGGLDLPSGGSAAGGSSEIDDLAGTLRRLGLDADLGFLFAIYEDPARGAGAMSVVYRGILRSRPDAAAPVALAPLDAVPWERIRDAALAAMLRRFIEERRVDIFGLYVGDAARGTVQPLSLPA